MRVGGIDEVGVLAFHHLHLLQALAHDLDVRNDVLDLADAVIEVAQLQSALLDGALGFLDVGTRLADRFLGKLVDQRQLDARVGRDLSISFWL